jgi:3-(3-hydroxy-phenyl)propionate hydroxylase
MILLLFLERPDGLSERLASALAMLAREPLPIETRVILTHAERGPPACRGLPAFVDVAGLAAARYAAAPGTCYLIRPDQHVSARWRRFDADQVRAAARRVLEGEVAPVMALADG